MDILLIDDETQFLASLAEGLQLHLKTCGIYTACNGEDALKIMQHTRVDVVVTDLTMPNMNGWEFLRRMQKRHPQVPVIIMSALARSCVEENLKHCTIVEYLEKPLDLAEVTRTVLAAVQTA